MIGYVAGDSPLHRAHPYTPLAAAGAMLLLSFAVSTPVAVWTLVLLAALFARLAGPAVLAVIAKPALLLVLPPWAVMIVLHAILGEDPRVAWGALSLSMPGIVTALVLGGRIAAIVLVSLTTLAVVSPARLVEAETARGAPFGRIFLLVSTLTFLPRTRQRAAQILEAQQMRGLRLGGSPLARLKALGPLVLPLVLGAMAEVDEQVLALESRAEGRGERGEGAPRRTSLDSPADATSQRTLRWGLLFVVIAAYGAKFAGAGL